MKSRTKQLLQEAPKPAQAPGKAFLPPGTAAEVQTSEAPLSGQASPVPTAGHSIAAAPARLQSGQVLQPKLVLGATDDPYEREADRVADQVVGGQAPPQIQRAALSGAGSTVTPEVESGVAGMRGGGRPLDADTRGLMESRLGHDFSRVRVHTGSQVAGLAAQMRARAFTVGSDVAFAPGQYQPSSSQGRRLLAHELTHVVQQGSGGERIQRAFIKDAETDADLFEMAPGSNDQPDLSAHTAAKKGDKLKITSVAMKHFLERHTFKHQQLTSDFRRFDATLWPVGTTVTEVLDGLRQALKTMEGRTNRNKMVNKIQTVTMGGKTCQVQVGMITGGKLEQFFPVSGDGCQQYTKQELGQIYQAKMNKPKAKPTPSAPEEGEVAKPPATTPTTGEVTKPVTSDK